MQSAIHFYGGAGTVTGSNFLLDVGDKKFLIDCGLLQTEHTCEDSNWNPFPFEPSEISALIVTHAHIDHIGRVPLLVKRGFKGPVISTEATKAIAEPLLLDSMELLEAEARRCHNAVLYEEKDIEQAMRQWEVLRYHEPRELGSGVTLTFLNSGHILGSAMALLRRGFAGQARSIVFTGDLGGGNSPLLPPCEVPEAADYLVMESVYGDRVRRDHDHMASGTRDALEDIIEDTAAAGGTLLIPAFSTERTQDLLFEVRELMIGKRVPSMPVFIDSPLAEQMTESFTRYPQYFAPEIERRLAEGEKIFAFPQARFTPSLEASRAADAAPAPKIIIAGSGMSQGGRIREHETHVLPDKKSTLLIVGYQAAGSVGRRLVEGAQSVRLGKSTVSVRCRVEALYGYSAHMDGEQLVDFVNKFHRSVKRAFVVMGEPLASATLTQRLRDYLGVNATAPEAGEKAVIEF
jgi:metallo-beta-lactamase family protein